MNCPCGSQQLFSICCQPILDDSSKATTALSLMRARYTAHVQHHVDFVVQTVHPSTRPLHQAPTIQQWMDQTTWEGLTIRQTKAGDVTDQEGWVWFEAVYRQDGQRATHCEYSHFKRVGEQWYFVEGKEPPQLQKIARKVARNAPCPCGSGKKYKRCCGQAE